MIASTDIIIIVNLPFPSQHLFCHQIVVTQHRCSPPAEIQAPGGTQARNLNLIFNLGVVCKFLEVGEGQETGVGTHVLGLSWVSTI